MAADFLVINRNKQPGNQYVRCAQLLSELRSLVESLNAAGNHCVDGSDYTVFEAQFGVATGAGANAMNLIGLIRGVLNTSDEIPGANRKAWLDEFVARVAVQ